MRSIAASTVLFKLFLNDAYGHWGWVVILIVVVSWVLYRFVAPKGWREWAGAGLVQAFIIALYAEMYGFPLTIYLLVVFSASTFPCTSRAGICGFRSLVTVWSVR